jgi:hypothetical protein
MCAGGPLGRRRAPPQMTVTAASSAVRVESRGQWPILASADGKPAQGGISLQISGQECRASQPAHKRPVKQMARPKKSSGRRAALLPPDKYT